jgi:hypothetical protein
MNKVRRKALDDIKARIEGLKEELDFLKEEEEMAFDNLPESLQGSDRGEKMEEYIQKIADAVSSLEDAVDYLNLDE